MINKIKLLLNKMQFNEYNVSKFNVFGAGNKDFQHHSIFLHSYIGTILIRGREKVELSGAHLPPL